jgi:hypothetical protein
MASDRLSLCKTEAKKEEQDQSGFHAASCTFGTDDEPKSGRIRKKMTR